MAHYTDTSIFQGWKEWTTPDSEYRAEYQGSGVWGVYEREGDAFIRCATVAAPKRASCLRLTEAL